MNCKSFKEFNFILNELNGLVFIKFSAEWCNACVELKDFYNTLFNDVEFQRVNFIDVDVDISDNCEIVEFFDVQHLPAFVLLKKDGDSYEVLEKKEDVNNKIIIEIINSHL